ncbi:hypothetical protein M5K25_003393 [Dendrobium thyrsiflorum]|uniref:Uncharacterized protein n=1 Tax=Dendrobium thyrsiflorum TaxID=117978 RepID=A0ABD0VK29_DENTH
MSPNQGLKALLEGSNRNSDYETVSKFDNLIVESSGSTRRVQRAQEHRNPTSLRTLEPKLEEIKGEIEDRSCPPCSSSTTAGVPSDHRLKALQFAGPPPKGPTARRSAQGPTFCLRPDVLPKALRPTQGSTPYSRPDALLKARHSV